MSEFLLLSVAIYLLVIRSRNGPGNGENGNGAIPPELLRDARIMIDRLKPYQPFIDREAKKNGVDPQLVMAMIWAESSGNPNAIGDLDRPAGYQSYGLMQITRGAAIDVGYDPNNLMDPETNIAIGVAYLALMYAKFHAWDLAVCAYNAGAGNVEAGRTHQKKVFKFWAAIEEVLKNA